MLQEEHLQHQVPVPEQARSRSSSCCEAPIEDLYDDASAEDCPPGTAYPDEDDTAVRRD